MVFVGGENGGGEMTILCQKVGICTKTMFIFCPRLLWFIPPSIVHDHPGL